MLFNVFAVEKSIKKLKYLLQLITSVGYNASKIVFDISEGLPEDSIATFIYFIGIFLK